MTTTRMLETAVILLGLTAASAATAQDRAPVLTEIRDGTGGAVARRLPQGAVVQLVGRNLHKCPDPVKDENGILRQVKCSHDELTVKIDGKDMMVLPPCTFDALYVQLPPDAKPGKRTIEVSIQGRGKATIEFEVVTQEEYKKQAEELAGHELMGPQRADQAAKIRDKFQITKFQMLPGAAGARFVIEGTAGGIPDRFRVDLALQYDGRDIMNRSVMVKDEAFATTLGPFSQKLLYGVYACEMVFSMDKQAGALVRRWERQRSKAGSPLTDQEREVYSRVLRRELVEVGTGPQGKVTPDDRKRQTDELQAHNRELVEATRAIMRELEEAWAGAKRCTFKDPGQAGYHEDKYKRWLVRADFAKDEAEAEKLAADTNYGTSSGHFKPEAWEALVSGPGGLIERLKALHQKQREFATAYICAMDDRAQMLGDYLITGVQIRLQQHSRELYGQSKLDVPAPIQTLHLAELMTPPDDSIKFFEAKGRELLRQVGLGDLVGNTADGSK